MLELALDGRDALAHHAAVDLELALAFAEARSHAAAHAVGGQVGPHAAQARQQVLVLGEPHLQPALLAGGVQGEDVEDERRTVDDLHVAAHRLLEVRLLGGRQLVVEHDEVGRVGARKLGHFFGLARAHERTRIGRVELLRGGGHRVGACRIHEALELGERRCQRPRGAGAIHADEHGALAALFGDRGHAPRDD